MKKLFPGILALLMAFSCFVACGEKTPDSSTPAGSTPPASTPGDSTPDDSTPDEEDPLFALNAVKEVLNGAMIKKNVEMRKDYTVANQWYSWHTEEIFEITWTVTDAEGNATTNVTIEEGDGDYDTVKVNSNLEEDFTYILKGTISDSKGQSVDVSFTRKVLKAGEYLPVAITAKPAEDTVYKLYVYQTTEAQDCYFVGEMDDFYYKTSTVADEGVDLYVEHITDSDAFNVYFTDAKNVKQYIGVQEGWNSTKNYWTFNVVFNTTPPSSFVWSDEYQTIITTVPCRSAENNKNQAAEQDSTETLYLGNYGTYKTFSASKLSHAATSNVGGLVTMVHKDDIKVPDADKVAAVKESLSVQLNHTLDKELTLKIADDRYSDVSISWSVEADKGATVANDKLNLVIPAEATEVVLTATVSCGDVSEDVAFTLVLGPKTVTPDATDANAIVAAAFNLAAGETLPGGTYTLTGVVSNAGEWSTKYNNVTIKMIVNEKEFECYAMTCEQAVAEALKVGDTVTVSGTIKNYNGKVEFDKGCTLDNVVAGGEDVGGGETPDPTPDPEPEVPTIQTLTIAEAIAKGKEQTSDGDQAYTTEMYYATGTITGFYTNGTTYGNVYIKDENGDSILVYGLYLMNEDGSQGNRYDKMETKPIIGDTIKILAVVGNYKGTAQFKDAFLIEHTAHTHDYKAVVTDPTCTADGFTTYTCSICNDTYKADETTATGHTTENGTCENCGKEISPENPGLTEKTYSYTFTEAAFSANGTKMLNDVNWTIAGDGSYWGFDSQYGKGQQFGSGGKPYKSLTVSSESFSNVSKITINTSGAKDINGTCKVYVGDTLIDTITLTKTATDYSFEVAGLTGEVKFVYEQTSSKAFYIKSININYAE